MKPETEIKSAEDSKTSSELKNSDESVQEKNLLSTMNDLYQAIDKGDAEKVQAILSADKFNIDAYHPLRDDNPLIYAVTNLYYDMAKLLLELGANPNIKKKNNNTYFSEIILRWTVGKKIMDLTSQSATIKAQQAMMMEMNRMTELVLCYDFSQVELGDLKIMIDPLEVYNKLKKSDFPLEMLDKLNLKHSDPIKSLTGYFFDLIDRSRDERLQKSHVSYNAILGMIEIQVHSILTSGSFDKEYAEDIKIFQENSMKELDIIQQEKKALFFSYQKSPKFEIISSCISVDTAKIVLSYAIDFSKEILEERIKKENTNKL